MKAQRRHELQQNVLDAELGKLVGFLRRRGALLLWGLAAVVLVGLVAWYAYSQKVGKIASIQSKYDSTVLLQNAPGSEEHFIKSLNELAAQNTIEWIAADACVRLGDVSFRQAQTSSSQADAAELMAKAASWYNKAVQNYPGQKMAVAKAHFGLGQWAEQKGDFEEARGQYTAVIEQKDLAAYPVAALAKSKLRNLDSLTKPVVMATTLPAAPGAVQLQPGQVIKVTTPPAPATAPADGKVDKNAQKADKKADKKK
jgi:hypothetical protein